MKDDECSGCWKFFLEHFWYFSEHDEESVVTPAYVVV